MEHEKVNPHSRSDTFPEQRGCSVVLTERRRGVTDEVGNGLGLGREELTDGIKLLPYLTSCHHRFQD